MKKIFLILFLSLFLFVGVADAAVRVKGYFRKDGTYVQPHYRSNPDGNPYNNYSYPGNTNPYTGETATGDPDTYLKNYKSPSYSYPSYVPTPTPIPIPTPKPIKIISCPLNSHSDTSKSLDKCFCNTGYVPNPTLTFCVLSQATPRILGSSYSNPLNLQYNWLVKTQYYSGIFYVDENLCLHWIPNEQVALNNFGRTWNYEGNIKVFDSFMGYNFCDDLK